MKVDYFLLTEAEISYLLMNTHESENQSWWILSDLTIHLTHFVYVHRLVLILVLIFYFQTSHFAGGHI